MSLSNSVLFVSHDAFRAGATLILINFLRWFKKNTDIPFRILICKRGELDGEFEELAPVWYLDPHAGRKAALKSAFRRLTGRSDGRKALGFSELAPRIAAATSVGLIYSNTVANGRALESLAPLRCPVLTHVHELELAIRTFGGKDFEQVKRRTDHFIAVSDAVRDNLIARHGIAGARVERIHGFVPTAAQPRVCAAALRQGLAAETGIPANARIVGGCGTVDWRKGCDLFLQLALSMRKRNPAFPVHLLWLGAKLPGDYGHTLQHDLERAGLAGSVHFIGPRPNPLDYIATFDVLALVSREDPFPLVIMEAAALGVPTVCFEGAGGGREFVEEDAGRVVPYLDLEAMADCVLDLLRSDDLRSELGRRARDKVRERHDLDVVAPRLLRTIERMLATGG